MTDRDDFNPRAWVEYAEHDDDHGDGDHDDERPAVAPRHESGRLPMTDYNEASQLPKYVAAMTVDGVIDSPDEVEHIFGTSVRIEASSLLNDEEFVEDLEQRL